MLRWFSSSSYIYCMTRVFSPSQTLNFKRVQQGRGRTHRIQYHQLCYLLTLPCCGSRGFTRTLEVKVRGPRPIVADDFFCSEWMSKKHMKQKAPGASEAPFDEKKATSMDSKCWTPRGIKKMSDKKRSWLYDHEPCKFCVRMFYHKNTTGTRYHQDVAVEASRTRGITTSYLKLRRESANVGSGMTETAQALPPRVTKTFASCLPTGLI